MTLSEISRIIGEGQDVIYEAGLHPATGGDGMLACSGDLLPEPLVACAGVILSAVSTAIGISIKEGIVKAEGDLDFKVLWVFQRRFHWVLKISA